MSLSKVKFQKYNIYMTMLFNLIISLNPEEHRFLLKKVEKLVLKEKRASARKVCRIPARYLNNDRVFNNFILNISRTGCFIETPKPLAVGEIILMDIQLDGSDESLRIKGEVAHANRGGMGIEFKEVTSNLAEKLGILLFKII